MSCRQHWLPQVESDLSFFADFLQHTKLRCLFLIFRVLAVWGSACVKFWLQEAAERKLWLLAVLSCILEPFGVKVVHSRASPRTGLTREVGPFGPKDFLSLHWHFSCRYLLYTENESCRFLEYHGLGNRSSCLCVYMSVRS